MPVPEPRLLLLCEAACRVADRCGVSIEEAKAALDRAFRQASLVPYNSSFEKVRVWEDAVIDWEHSSLRFVNYTIEGVHVFRQHLDDWMAQAAPGTGRAFAAKMLRASAEGPMTTPQPWRFLEPYWDVRDALGWLIDRDPKRFGRIFNHAISGPQRFTRTLPEKTTTRRERCSTRSRRVGYRRSETARGPYRVLVYHLAQRDQKRRCDADAAPGRIGALAGGVEMEPGGCLGDVARRGAGHVVRPG